MRRLFILAMGSALVGSWMSLSACALNCSATDSKLARLRRDMSYQQAAEIMGCSGMLVTSTAPESGAYSIVEWNGPGSIFKRTRMDFMNGKLLSYTTEPRGAL